MHAHVLSGSESSVLSLEFRSQLLWIEGILHEFPKLIAGF